MTNKNDFSRNFIIEMTKRLRDHNNDINSTRICDGCNRSVSYNFYSFIPRMKIKENDLNCILVENDSSTKDATGIDYCNKCFNKDRCKTGNNILAFMVNHDCDCCCIKNKDIIYYDCILNSGKETDVTIGLCIPCIKNCEDKPSFDFIC